MFNRSFHNLFIESMILGATLLASTSAHAEDRNLVAVTGTQTNTPSALAQTAAGIAELPLSPNHPRFGYNSSETTIAQTPKIPAINSDASVLQTNSMSQVTSDLVTKEDLTTLQRLQAEFAPELATLRGRVDSLEARTAELEANQFSTTTKLSAGTLALV